MFFKRVLLVGAFVVSSLSFANALTDNQAELYKKALKLLDEKNYDAYYPIKARLKNTDLYPYLKYKEIASDPKLFSQDTIQDFYTKYKDQYWISPLSEKLAEYYAESNQWDLFNKYYDGNLGVSGKCWKYQSEYELGNKETALNDFGKLWQDRIYLPKACNVIQKYWDDSADKNKDYVVTKAYTLAFAGKFSDALWLLKQYVKNNDDYVNYISAWQEASKKPSTLDNFIAKYHKYRRFNDVFLDISKGLVKKDDEEYAKLWDSLNNKQLLNTKVKHESISMIAVSFAHSQSPAAKQWLKRVDPKYLNDVAWEWILRIELYNDNYSGFIKTYAELPDNLKSDEAWKYWLAYSYKKTGQESKAKPIFEDLTKEKLDYYSFLASDELGKPYNFGHVQPKKLSKQDLKELAKEDAIQQSIDLFQIDQYKDSSNVWKSSIRNKLKAGERSKIEDLAQVAESNKMYYAAIFNMAVLGDYSNIPLLFPAAFESDVNAASKKYGVDKALIYSVMRKESLFDVDAGSWAGAKGLMQLTIPTAEFITKKYRVKLKGDKNAGMDELIFNPYNNINLGAANLYFLDTLFDKNVILGLAAYNAGPGNVAKWLTDKKLPAPQWIENVPYKETRYYIRKILVYMITYNNFVFKNDKYKLSDFLDVELSKEQSFRK
ncbi:lytic transglycosylase domain-containing protein [Francisella frigiditurris]|uniref:Transglycosylase SLT domain protein n=1 Tax=Francisella frigiditurris TaxID=1542390 RepID=A0A1J0KT16_9GAMM|nr:lytic transglycosylase domain-containing protein [Francisella frigiditurris]APC96772.1 transglycosylase SLT domain protein [Francisella frigiditurris]